MELAVEGQALVPPGGQDDGDVLTEQLDAVVGIDTEVLELLAVETARLAPQLTRPPDNTSSNATSSARRNGW